MTPTQLRALDLLQSSSCYRGDVCGSLPCACAETIAKLIEEEREQCALIAEQSALHHNGIKVGTGIAAKIRDRR